MASNETPAERFIKLAEMRTEKAIAAIRKISKLKGRSYESTPEQIGAILSALRSEIDAVEEALKSGEELKGGFRLPR